MLAFADPDLDNGPRTDRSATMRMCAVTRQVRPIDELIRFVVAPSGEVIPDLKRKLPGRGLWVSASRQAVAEAVRRNQFGKGFKRDVRVAPTLAADTEALLVRSAIEALAMAAKAGQVVSGFGKVEDALRPRQAQASIGALIHASDGAADGIRKLDAIVRQNAGINDESHRISGRHGADIGTIGFGTGPVKCDTCCPARGPGEQDVPVAQPDPGPIPDGGRRQDSRQCGQEFADTDCADTHDVNKIRTAEWLIRKRLATRH